MADSQTNSCYSNSNMLLVVTLTLGDPTLLESGEILGNEDP